MVHNTFFVCLHTKLLSKSSFYIPMYFMSTGISHSHTRRDLSSEVETNRRFSSTNVILFTAPKWRSYSCKKKEEMVFCDQNCSDLLWEKNCSSDQRKTFEIRGWRPIICKIFEITWTISGNRMLFQLVSGGFADLKKIKLEKMI